MQFQVENFSYIYPEILRLWKLHWGEISLTKNLFPLNPDIQMYKKLEASGALKIITCRTSTGVLVGYYFAIIKKNLHYQVITSSDDIYYLHPDWRKGWIGVRLFLEAENVMRESKAVLSLVREKLAHPHEKLMQRLGYSPIEMIYMKVL